MRIEFTDGAWIGYAGRDAMARALVLAELPAARGGWVGIGSSPAHAGYRGSQTRGFRQFFGFSSRHHHHPETRME